MSNTQVLHHAAAAAKSGNPDLARIHLQKAAASDPDDPSVWLWMSWLADSPLCMIQCLEMVQSHPGYRQVAQAGLTFARALAAWQGPDTGSSAVKVVEDVQSAIAEEIARDRGLQARTNDAQAAAAGVACDEPHVADPVDTDALVSEPEANDSTAAPAFNGLSAGTGTAQRDAAVVAENPVSLWDGLGFNAGLSNGRDDAAALPDVAGPAAGDWSDMEFDDPAADDFALISRQHGPAVEEPAEPEGESNIAWRAAQSDWFCAGDDCDRAAQPPERVSPVFLRGGRNPDGIDCPESFRQPPAIPDLTNPATEQSAPDAPVEAEGGTASAAVDRFTADHSTSHPSDAEAHAAGTGSGGGLRSLWNPPQLREWVPTEYSPPETVVEARPTAVSNGITSTDSIGSDDLATAVGPGSGVAATASGQRTVLVVDDSPTVRKLVAMTLEKRGYHVVPAFDGVAAIKEIATHNPALILMDVSMPRLDGYQLCRLVRRHENTRHIPVLMLSGRDGMFDRLRGRLVGCSGYITKPFVPEELVEIVEQYLQPRATS